MSSEDGGQEEQQSSDHHQCSASASAPSTTTTPTTTNTSNSNNPNSAPTSQTLSGDTECVGRGYGSSTGSRGGGGRIRRLSETGPSGGGGNNSYWKRGWRSGGGGNYGGGGGGGGWKYRKRGGWSHRKRAMSQPLERTNNDSLSDCQRTPEREENPIPFIRRSISLGHSASKKARRHRKKLKHKYGNAKRLRFGTQPAPSNNNEFLMQEHDHLHFEENHHHLCNDEDRRSDELNAYYSSSPEDEEEYLVRDFSNTYDGVHKERLNAMSKSELISEYQMLEERVESLEQMVKRTRMSSESMEPSPPPFYYHAGSGITDRFSPPTHDMGIEPIIQQQPTSSSSLSIIPKIDPETVRATLQELSQLRAENEKLRAENSVLKETKAIPSV